MTDDDDDIATHVARDDEAKEAGRQEGRARAEKAEAALASMTNEMLDCRASWAIACESLTEAERERDDARAACCALLVERAKRKTGEDDPLIEAALDDVQAVGRGILGALVEAEAALRQVIGLVTEESHPERRATVNDALAAIKALGIRGEK